jgi:hypothetical protein
MQVRGGADDADARARADRLTAADEHRAELDVRRDQAVAAHAHDAAEASDGAREAHPTRARCAHDIARPGP